MKSCWFRTIENQYIRLNTGRDSIGYRKEQGRGLPHTNKKESEEKEESRKMLKHKEEIPQNMLVEVNKNNKNISLQLMEQTNIDAQTQLERHKRGSTSTNGEIENACEPNLYPDHVHEDIKAKSQESAINKENTHKENVETPSVTGGQPDEEMEVETSDSLKDTKEEITHEKKVESPITASTRNKENLPPVVVEANTGVGDMQASMLSQIKNIEPDDFKVVTYKKSKARKA
ncbi:37335_t:CDS:2, partial [Gigaspora margarita]